MNNKYNSLNFVQKNTGKIVRRTLFTKFWGIRSGRAGLILALFLLTVVSIGPVFVEDDPNAINLENKLARPSTNHWFGTDNFGRDQLARVLVGGRTSLGAALIVMGCILIISLTVGIAAGMAGGIIDMLLMRFVDVLLALPSLIVALAIVGVLGVGLHNMMMAIIISSWAYYARLTRSYVINARQRQDIIADRLAGISWPRIVTGHILPGVFSQVIIILTLHLGGIIIDIAGLSFLGLGIQPPMAEWGAMLSGSRLYFARMPWLLIIPGTAIFLSVATANLIGNALRSASSTEG